MRILLIDDHALFRIGLQGLLTRRGIEVVAAIGDGREGLKLVSDLSPDIVLLDLRMPDISGLGILRKMRGRNPDVAVVMLTTSSDENDLLQALRGGARGYLLKDMEPDELVAALINIDRKSVV